MQLEKMRPKCNLKPSDIKFATYKVSEYQRYMQKKAPLQVLFSNQ